MNINISIIIIIIKNYSRNWNKKNKIPWFFKIFEFTLFPNEIPTPFIKEGYKPQHIIISINIWIFFKSFIPKISLSNFSIFLTLYISV